METTETEIRYFLVVDGEKRGPFPLDDLIDAGMRFETPVWWEGLESWPLAGKIPKLNALLKEEGRRRLARRRADRLPEPAPIRQLGRFSVLANLPTAVVFFLSTSSLWTSFLLSFIAVNPLGQPPAQPSAVLLGTSWWLFVGGLAGTVIGIPLFVVEAGCVARLVLRCRTVARMAVPSAREEKALRELSGSLSDLANVDIGGPSIPMLDLEDCLLIIRVAGQQGGMAAIGTLLVAVFSTLCLMVGPAIFCLLRPQTMALMITLAVVLVIYGIIHIPIVVAMFATVNRTGYELNHAIDTIRLKMPWAPIGVTYWTCFCGLLMMAGPFSLVFFILLAIWAWKTSEVAARICDDDSRDIIARPPPPKLPSEINAAPKVEF